MKNIFDEIDSFRTGETEQHYRQDVSPAYENEYIKLIRIDSSNQSGGKTVLRGKQWSIIFELKKPFTMLIGWRRLKEYYGEGIKITSVNKGALKGNYGLRLYHMSSNPTDNLVIDILDYIFQKAH